MRWLIFCIAGLMATPIWADEQPVITVTGLGEVAVAPDMARITVGVTQEARTARAAMDAFNADVASVLAQMEAAGVAAVDMQTSGLSLRPVQDYSSASGPRITGYVAGTQVATTVRDLDDLPALLDRLVSEGATDLGGLEFDVADRAPHLQAARRAAVAEARSKADTFADAAGLTVGPVLMMQESNSAGPPPMMEMRAMAADSGVPVAAGEITISATITIRYGLD